MTHSRSSSPSRGTTLRLARARLLARLRAMDSESAVHEAAARYALLASGPWPAWLDRGEVEDQRNAMDARQDEHESVRRATNLLRRVGALDAAETTIADALTNLSWRLDASSPDAHVFFQTAMDAVASIQAARANGTSWAALSLPFVPDPNDTLTDVWDSPIGWNGELMPLGRMIATLENGAMALVVQHEMLTCAVHHIPKDARDPLFVAAWTIALSRLQRGDAPGWHEGSWIETLRWWPLRKVLSTHGRQARASGLAGAMEGAKAAMDDLNAIGGKRRIQIWRDDGVSAGFAIEPEGRMLGDDPDHPWAHTALRGALIDAMARGAALLVDRSGAIAVDGKKVRETYAARMENGAITWFSAESCKAAFSFDHQTGQRLPPDPGRVYRDGPTKG